MSDQTRIETDSLGNVEVPSHALYGAQTQRAYQNFPVSGLRLPRRLIRALALIKKAAAEVNRETGVLPADLTDAIARAAAEVAGGQHDEQFPLDVFQTGSGTSSNMNANEVIGNRAFAPRVLARLAAETGLPLRRAPNLFEALAARDGLVEASGALRGTAVSLTKVANDIRWLGSGPRCGIGEIHLPDLQPGSSIMPGKVNPVMCEMLLMVCAQVIGNDASVGWGGAAGNFELNVMIPVIAFNFLQSVEILASACRLFADRCVQG